MFWFQCYGLLAGGEKEAFRLLFSCLLKRLCFVDVAGKVTRNNSEIFTRGTLKSFKTISLSTDNHKKFTTLETIAKVK